MPYVTKYRTVTKYREAQKDLGYDLIAECRPKFIFFSLESLRPSTPHWVFFDGVQVNKWINTSFTLDDYNSSARNSDLRNPGDQYLNATAFPDTLGGPTAASGPLNTDANGKLEGVFYLQSNATTSFPAGKRSFTAIDISVLKQQDSLSYGSAQYSAIGQEELYYEYQEAYKTQEAYQVYVAPPSPPSNNSSNDNDNNHPRPFVSVNIGNTWYNSYGPPSASFSNKATGGTITGGTGVSSSSVGKKYGGGGGGK